MNVGPLNLLTAATAQTSVENRRASGMAASCCHQLFLTEVGRPIRATTESFSQLSLCIGCRKILPVSPG